MSEATNIYQLVGFSISVANILHILPFFVLAHTRTLACKNAHLSFSIEMMTQFCFRLKWKRTTTEKGKRKVKKTCLNYSLQSHWKLYTKCGVWEWTGALYSERAQERWTHGGARASGSRREWWWISIKSSALIVCGYQFNAYTKVFVVPPPQPLPTRKLLYREILTENYDSIHVVADVKCLCRARTSNASHGVSKRCEQRNFGQKKGDRSQPKSDRDSVTNDEINTSFQLTKLMDDDGAFVTDSNYRLIRIYRLMCHANRE